MVKEILLCSLIKIILSALNCPAEKYGITMECQYFPDGKYATIYHTSCAINKVDYGVGVMSTDNPNNARLVRVLNVQLIINI